jgi:hypothetical protein
LSIAKHVRQKVGMRCEVSPGGRRGVVLFKGCQPPDGTGKFPGDGWWLGVKFDEPVGKGDGTAQVHTRRGENTYLNWQGNPAAAVFFFFFFLFLFF